MAHSFDSGGWAGRNASRQDETAGRGRIPVLLGLPRRNAWWGRVRTVPQSAAIDPRTGLRPDGPKLGSAILWSTGRPDLVADRKCARGGLLHLSVSLVSRQGHPGRRGVLNAYIPASRQGRAQNYGGAITVNARSHWRHEHDRVIGAPGTSHFHPTTVGTAAIHGCGPRVG